MARKEHLETNKGASLSRRDLLLRATLLAGSTLLVDTKGLAQLARNSTDDGSPYPEGRLLTILPFAGERTIAFGQPTKLNAGLDTRQHTDLSLLAPDALITATDKFFVRTSCPDQIDYSKPWTIKIRVAADDTRVISMKHIDSMVHDMGVHLMECAGNDRPGQFGLMSACRWEGVAVTALLKSLKLEPADRRICISGFDHHSKRSATPGLRYSVPGASWIFTMEQLKSTGAFLATKMNGKPLLHDHGYPVRLVVPGWYGCTCIKWVDEIAFTNEDADATPQMIEFADRTHQVGVPQLACEYRAAVIEQAAMPVRVEQWDVGGSKKYNVVGIMWGGSKLTADLQIRFRPDENFVPVELYHQTTNSTWTLWSHRWAPAANGLYDIQLRVANPSIPAGRLDKGYYGRSVKIIDV